MPLVNFSSYVSFAASKSIDGIRCPLDEPSIALIKVILYGTIVLESQNSGIIEFRNHHDTIIKDKMDGSRKRGVSLIGISFDVTMSFKTKKGQADTRSFDDFCNLVLDRCRQTVNTIPSLAGVLIERESFAVAA